MNIEEVTALAESMQSEMESFVTGMMEVRNPNAPMDMSRLAAKMTYILMKLAETNIRITELRDELLG